MNSFRLFRLGFSSCFRKIEAFVAKATVVAKKGAAHAGCFKGLSESVDNVVGRFKLRAGAMETLVKSSAAKSFSRSSPVLGCESRLVRIV